MQNWSYEILGCISKNFWGVRLIKFLGFWGRSGGVAKMFENIFLENDGYGEQKPKMKNTKKKIAKFVS